MKEWRCVVGYEGYYEVSNDGIVRSVDRVVVRADGVMQRRTGRIKKIRVNDDGYASVRLSANGNDRQYYVHRLVYEAFVGPIPEGYEVNHIDFDTTNNCVSNLEILSHADNVKYTYAAGRHVTTKNDMHGANNPNYGNHTLSERYRCNPELSRAKQCRPGLMNGRCRRVEAVMPDGDVLVFEYMQGCAQYLIDCGISRGKPFDVYQRIWKSIKTGKKYNNISFRYV